MKKVLILVIGCQLDPWNKMTQTSLDTWDNISVDGCETIYYFGEPLRPNTDNKIYFDIPEGYNNMGYKLLSAFDWILKSKEFDYIARVNGSCYVNKVNLINAVQDMPDNNLFAGIQVDASQTEPAWLWGGGQYIISKDVVQKVVDNQNKFNHSKIEDVSLSHLVTEIGIPFTQGKACAIDKTENGWRCLRYGGGESFEFTDWQDIKKADEYFFRCKHDPDRTVDEYVMKQLFNNL